MAEIKIKINSDIFNSGETLHGAVYLRIEGPTSGYGIKVTTKGLEQYCYHDVTKLTSPRRRLSDGCVEKCSKVLLDEQFILHMFDGPIAIGEYVFPFKVHIPPQLPASFCLKSWYGPRWMAEISYQVTAEVIGAEQIKVTIPIHVNHIIGDPDYPLEVKTSKKITSTNVFKSKKDFHFSIGLDKASYFIGEPMKFSIIFLSSVSVIKEIRIKLEREINFIQDQSSTPLASPNIKSDPPATNNEDQYRRRCIKPEERRTVWESAPLGPNVLLGSVLPTVYIPLDADLQGHGIQPTTDSSLIRCKYIIGLTIDLTTGESFRTEVLVPCISVKKTPFSTAGEESPWMKCCKIVLPMDFKPVDDWQDWSVYLDGKFPTLSLIRKPSPHREAERPRGMTPPT